MAITWPNFMNPAAAAIAAAIVIPALLALYFLKLKRRQIEVSSTFLWKKAIQDLQVNAPFQRLRRNLLLLLQLLILLALILALAQPVMKRNKSMGKMSVILIDRSASMSSMDGKRNESRLDEAKDKAKAVVSSLPKDGLAMVMAFDEGAEVVQSFTSDPVLLRTAIDSIKPTQMGSKLRTALSLVEARSLAFISDQLRPNEAGSDLWVFSDGKIEDLDRVALKSASLKEYVSVGSAQSVNVGIVALSAKRNIERPTEVQVFARLENHGPKVIDATAQLSIDGRIPTGGVRRGIRLAPAGWTEDQRVEAEKNDKDLSTGGVEFNVEITKGAVIKVEVKDVDADVFPHDDAAQIVAPPPKTMGVVLVGNKENPAIEKYLEADFTIKSAKISGEEYEAEIKKDNGLDFMKKYDVVIFDRYQPSKLPPAGNFMYFAVVPPETAMKYALEDDGREVTNEKETALDWNRDHPLMKGILNMKLFCQWTLKLKAPLEAETIIEGNQGPLLVLYREGRHAHLVFPFDLLDSTWPLIRSYTTFMVNCMQYLALGSDMDFRQSYTPGSAVKIPRHALSNIKKLKLNGPPGFETLDLPVGDSGDFALPPFPQVGVYSVSPEVPSYERFAVNLLSTPESNIKPASEVKLAGMEGEGVKSSGGQSREFLWWWLVAAGAIPLCLIEWWIYTRRVHL